MPEPVAGWLVYQPVIVGLGAVVIGTLGNTLLEWYKTSLKNRDSAKALRRALAEELRLECEAANENSRRSMKLEKGGTLIVPIPERYPIYEANLHQIGLLNPDEIEMVVKSYGMMKAKLESINLFADVSRTASGGLQAFVPDKYAFIVTSNNKKLGEILGEAVGLLDRNSGRTKSAKRAILESTPLDTERE